jgi:hypothetical protein
MTKVPSKWESKYIKPDPRLEKNEVLVQWEGGKEPIYNTSFILNPSNVN